MPVKKRLGTSNQYICDKDPNNSIKNSITASNIVFKITIFLQVVVRALTLSLDSGPIASSRRRLAITLRTPRIPIKLANWPKADGEYNCNNNGVEANNII